MTGFPPDDDRNPFQAPTASLATVLGDVDPEAEPIRRSLFRHESEVRSLGLLNYLIAFPFGFIALGMTLGALGIVPVMTRGVAPERVAMVTAGVAVVAVLGTVLAVGVGMGLRRLQPWARWVTAVTVGVPFAMDVLYFGAWLVSLTGLVRVNDGVGDLVANGVLMAITGYILYLVLSRKGARVFSPEYRAVVRQTPQIQPKTALLVRLLVAFMVFLLSLAVIAGIFAVLTR